MNEQSFAQWVAGLSNDDAARALLMVGLPHEPPIPDGDHPIFWMPPFDTQWEPEAQAYVAAYEALPDGTRARIAVSGDTDDPRWILELLLTVPVVDSAWVVLPRITGALHRRPLQWPFRVATFGIDDTDFAALADAITGFPSENLDLRRWEDDPRAVDLLVVASPLAAAAPWAAAQTPVATVVVIVDRSRLRWSVTQAHLGTIRAASATAATALVSPDRDLAAAIGDLVTHLSHSTPLDVALTLAWPRDILLASDPEFMGKADLRTVAMRIGRDLATAAEALSEPLLAEHGTRLEAMAESGGFQHEIGEAHELATRSVAAAGVLAEQAPDRYLQCNVNGGPDAPGVFAAGEICEVTVWIGVPELGAVVNRVAFDDSRLDWDAAASYMLTVVFVPLTPPGPAQRDDKIELRAVGRSGEAHFRIAVRSDATDVAARILVLHRNRVLQTAVLQGQVGEQVELAEQVVLRQRLDDLDDRRPYDLALIANHDDQGKSVLVANRDGATEVVPPAGLDEQIRRIALALERAVKLKATKNGLPKSKRALKLVVELAKAGKDLHGLLEENVGSLATTARIQVFTARDKWLLPIELLYDRYSPDEKASLCPHYVATKGQGPCGDACAPASDKSIVCPLAFWGLSKTIERFHCDPKSAGVAPGTHVLLGQKKVTQQQAKIGRAALAVDQRVTDAERDSVATALPTFQIAKTWAEWCTLLETDATGLLVLLPHTDFDNFDSPVMFIADEQDLQRGEIEVEHVTGNRDDVDPFVILFGCETTGTKADPSGFAQRFMLRRAAVVFTSLTKLLGTHAAEMARRLTLELAGADSVRPVGERLTALRRAGVWDAMPAVLAITAYGDADWRV